MSVTLMLLVCSMAQAQLNRSIQNAAQRAAENAVVRQAERRTEQVVNQAIDNAFDNNSNANSNSQQQTNAPANSGNANNAAGTGTAAETPAPTQTPQQGGNAVEMAYAKSDFVAGDEIIFEDDQANEKMGEFPSMWDLLGGNAEIVSFGEQKAINISDAGTVTPLMKNPKNYLTDMFTIEFDYYKRDRAHTKGMNNRLHIYLKDESGKDVFAIYFFTHAQDASSYSWVTPEGENRSGETSTKEAEETWHHVSISFNKRAFKLYLDGARTVNIPTMKQPKWITFRAYSNSQEMYFIRNVRIAKGAVPLYDRMMSDGKFITYGITFDVGKSTIKPESMGEINRIVTLLKENPDLKFSVEGHTDNTGSAATNQTLSDARSKAVVDKLVENGIAKDRLTSAGKGQNNPIADNGTDEGRAKNRRVEFVKIN
jgi:outer membrane protein OmpA-like peptidoglycan-associated protein